MKLTDFLGEQVKSRRKALGLSQEEFAEKSGVSMALVSEIERGVANPTLSTLEKISQHLDVQAAQLIDTEGYIGNNKNIKDTLHESLEHLDTKQIKIILSILHLLKQ